MRKFVDALPVLLALFIVSGCSANAPSLTSSVPVISEVNSFNDITPTVEKLNAQYGPENVLIVSDIDNTLLTSVSDLGGDIWYQWQRGKLPIKPTQAQKVSCLYEDTIGFLYELAPMTLTELSVPEKIHTWQQAGDTVMALTSRAPKYRAPTERELHRFDLDFSSSALLPADTSSVNYRDKLDRELSYSQGIMMTTGMNKGDMLHWLLDKTERHFSAIVFIDDSRSNIDNMYNAWQNSNDTEMHIFYYTHVEEARVEKFGKILTQAQADKMASDYERLTATLHEVFPARPKDTCLSVD